MVIRNGGTEEALNCAISPSHVINANQTNLGSEVFGIESKRTLVGSGIYRELLWAFSFEYIEPDLLIGWEIQNLENEAPFSVCQVVQLQPNG